MNNYVNSDCINSMFTFMTKCFCHHKVRDYLNIKFGKLVKKDFINI